MSRQAVRERRRADRLCRLDHARLWSAELPRGLGLRAVVVFGSVARGDFHDESDIDVLVVAEYLPPDPVMRQSAIGSPAPGGIEAVAWTPDEWRTKQHRDPIGLEARDVGVWLVGTPELLGGPPSDDAR